MSASRRLLFVSFDFPPRVTSGVYRMRSLAKYLWQEGWNPTILCVQGPVAVWSHGERNEDDRLLQGLPHELEIVRTGYLDLRAWEGVHPANARPAGPSAPAVEERQSAITSLLWPVVRAVADAIRRILYFPDATSGWIPYAVAAAIRLHKTHHFSAIFTSNPPRSSLVVGLIFKRLYNVPWTAEFMDPWYPPTGPIRRRLERWLLRMIMRHADRIIVMTDEHAAALLAEFAEESPRIDVIPNGFDEANFVHLPQALAPRNNVLTFLHVGTIYPELGGRFFDAVEALVTEAPHLRSAFHIDIIGSPDNRTIDFAASDVGRELVTLHGYRLQRDALAAMLAADYLLLFLADEQMAKLCVSSKIYDYLRAGRPIVAVTYEGGVKRLVLQSGGLVLPPNDVDAIKRALHEVIRRARPGDSTSRDFADQFEYARLTARLAAILDETVASGSQADVVPRHATP